MVENPLGKPEWISRKRLVREVWKCMGVAAGLCLGLAAYYWAKLSDDQPMWKRLLILAIGICAGVGLMLFLLWYIKVRGA